MRLEGASHQSHIKATSKPPELGGLRFHGDGEAQEPAGVPAAGVHLVPVGAEHPENPWRSGTPGRNPRTHPRVSLVLRKWKHGSSMCIWDGTHKSSGLLSLIGGALISTSGHVMRSELTTISSIRTCSLRFFRPD